MSETIIISREIATVYVKVQSAVFAVAPRPAAVIYANRQGPAGANGTNGVGGYTDTEISDDAVAEFEYSYRVNSPNEVVLTIPEIDIEGKKIRVLQVGIGGCEIVFPDGVIVKIAGFSNQFIGGDNAWKLRENDIVELWVTGGEKWLLLATGGYSKFDL